VNEWSPRPSSQHWKTFALDEESTHRSRHSSLLSEPSPDDISAPPQKSAVFRQTINCEREAINRGMTNAPDFELTKFFNLLISDDVVVVLETQQW
jgi:hypothetical protein